MFTKFSTKVILALREDGSKAEYQTAISWCQDLQSVLKEFETLGLSNVSDAYAEQLQKYTGGTKEFITSFKQTISKYERSMGGKAGSGVARGSGRKVQWAYFAAQDLEKFSRSVQMQLEVLRLCMASKTLYGIVSCCMPFHANIHVGAMWTKFQLFRRSPGLCKVPYIVFNLGYALWVTSKWPTALPCVDSPPRSRP